jgi:lysophospholipase
MDLQPAPFHADIPGEPVAQAYWARASDGVRIRVASWPKEDAKGTVLLFPGRTEYIEKYAVNAGDFAERGYATISIDWRGQGLADRVNPNPMAGHVAEFADYQLDVAAMVQAAEQIGMPRPYFLLAHSMGGCIGLRALSEGLDVQAASFTGPMWGIGLSALVRPVAWGLSGIGCGLGLGNALVPGTKNRTYVLETAFEDNTLTGDRQMYARMQAQSRTHGELTLGGPSLRWLNRALRECRNLARMDSPAVPCVTVLGTDEEIVDVHAIHDRMSRWPNGDLMLVEKGKHEILMEGTDLRLPATDRIAALFDDTLSAAS